MAIITVVQVSNGILVACYSTECNTEDNNCCVFTCILGKTDVLDARAPYRSIWHFGLDVFNGND